MSMAGPRTQMRVASIVLSATLAACTGSTQATVPTDWQTVTATVAPLPMAIAIPADWKGYSYKLGSVLYAIGPTDDVGAMSVQEDPKAGDDLSAYVSQLQTYCAQHGKTCVTPQIVHLPCGDAVYDPSNYLGKGSQAQYDFVAKNQSGVTALIFVSSTATSPPVWEQIARSFNPYAAALP